MAPQTTGAGDLDASTADGEVGATPTAGGALISTVAGEGATTITSTGGSVNPTARPTLSSFDSVTTSYPTTVIIGPGTTVTIVNGVTLSPSTIASSFESTSPSSSVAAATGSSDASGSNNPVAKGSGGGLSTGAKAGIAVGAVAIVAAIAGFLIWKFCAGKRRSRNRSAPYGQARVGTPGTSAPNSIEKGAPLVGAIAPVYRDSGSTGSGTQLPQQADDATVQSRFSTLYDQIELHAENFYKDASPMIPPAIEGALSRYDTPLLGAPLAARLEESPRATTILKHVLSYEISTTVVDPTSSNGRRSLLPTPLLALLQEVQSQQPTQQAGRRGVQGSAYSRLKQLAASYRSSPQSMPSTTSSSTREAASHFTRVFSLWADPQYDEARRTQHLTEVLDSAVKFSVWLLSQPETFELRWDGSPASSDKETTSSVLGEHTLVTIPALVKVTSGGGAQRLSRSSEKVLCKLVKRPI